MAHSMHFYRGKLYIAGGSLATGIESPNNVIENLQCFDLTTSTVTHLKSLPYSRFFAGNALYNGKIYLCGGWGQSEGMTATNPTDTILVYDIGTDDWSVETECKLPAPIYCSSSVIVFPEQSLLN